MSTADANGQAGLPASDSANHNMSSPAATGSQLSGTVEQLIQAAVPGDGSIRDQMQNEILRRRDSSNSDRSNFALLESWPGLAQDIKDRVRLVDVLDRYSKESTSLREALGKDLSLKSLRQFASEVDEKRLETYLGNDKSLSPTIIAAVFLLEPEGVMVRMIASGELLEKEDTTVRQNVASILQRLKTKDVASAALNKMFTDAPELTEHIPAAQRDSARDKVKRIARLQSISPSPAALRALWNVGANSADAVSRVSIDDLQRALNLSVEESATIRDWAIKATNRNRELAANLRSAIVQPGFSHVLGTGSQESRVVQVQDEMAKYGMNPTLEGLLGSLDYGLVNEDQTVYSPTAYFVDLLQYLRKAKTDISTLFNDSRADQAADFRGTALQALYRRRPDLLHMNLSPENTTTVLPYIDLVNEVMESFVCHLPEFKKDTSRPRQANIDAYNVEDRDSEDLLAQPQNFKTEAYRQLAGAVYPTQLPYHQPLDAQRAFLSFLGTSRLELVSEFRTRAPDLNDRARHMHRVRLQANGQPDSADAVPQNAEAHLTALQEHALEAQQYCEVLGICQEEYLIWTKGVFWEKDHFIHTEGLQSLSDAEYRRRVGLKEPWHCYGYDSADAMLSASTGLSQVKRELLPRLGISYAALVDLIQTTFCNPDFPVGRDKLIMESLKYSYRYLQTFIDSKDPRSYAGMAQFLAQNELLMVHFRTGNATATKNNVDLLASETAALQNWLAQHFETLGKVIVLERGESPTLRVTGLIRATDRQYDADSSTENTADFESGRLMVGSDRYKSAVVGRLNADGSITRTDGARIGSVDIKGWVSFGTPSQTSTVNQRYPNLHFTVESSKIEWQILSGKLCQKQPFERNDLWIRSETTAASNIDKTRLVHLDGSNLSVDEWDRIHLFARVWRTLKWSVSEADRALIAAWKTSRQKNIAPLPDSGDGDAADPTSNEDAIKFNDFVDADGKDVPHRDSDHHLPELPTIDFRTVKELAALVQIVSLSNLPVENVLTIWTPMSSNGPKSQYNKLFRKRNLRQIDPYFEPDRNGNLFADRKTTVSSKRLTVIAALSIGNTDLEYLLDNVLGKDSTLSLQKLSQIYAYKLLARILSVQITDLMQISQAFGDPCESPSKALHVLEQWQQVAVTVVPWQELRFILDSVSTPDDPLALTQTGSLKVTKQLCDAVLKVHKEFPPVNEQSQLPALEEAAKTRLGLLLDESMVQEVFQLVQGTKTWDIPAPFVEYGKKELEDFQAALRSITKGRATYDISALTPLTASDPNAKPTRKCTFRVTGILSKDSYERILDAVKVLAQPKGRARAGKGRSAENYINLWMECLDVAKQKPIDVLRNTLTGVLPADVLKDEIDGANRNILAPDFTKEPSDDKGAGEISTKSTMQVMNGFSYDQDDFDTTVSASTSLLLSPPANSFPSAREEAHNTSMSLARPRYAKSVGTTIAQSVISLDTEPETDSEDDDAIMLQTNSVDDQADEDKFAGVRNAAEKLRFLLIHLTPFLHRRLTYSSVVDTMASVSGFGDVDLAKVLLENVLTPYHSSDASDSDESVKQQIANFLDDLPEQRTRVSARSLQAQQSAVASTNAELAESLFQNIYQPVVDGKRAYSMSSLLDQVANIANLRSFEATTILLNNILSLAPTSPQPALDFVMKSVSDSVGYWQGYLQPPETAKWVLEWRGQAKPEDILITEFAYTSQLDASLFVAQPSRPMIKFKQRIDLAGRVKYVSDPVSLRSDRKYAIRLPISWVGSENFLWRSSELADAKAVPESALRAWWRGFLYPSIRDVYSFSVKLKASGAVMILNNERRSFETREGEGNDGIWSAELNQTLDASTLHTLELHGCTPSDLMWKIGGNARVTVPDSVLLPEIAPAQMHVIFLKMKKLALAFKHLPLSPREVLFMKAQKTPLDFDGIHNVEEWLMVQNYVILKKALPATAPRSLLDLFSWSTNNLDASHEELKLQIMSTTGWSETSVDSMLTKANFTVGKPSDFRDAQVLSRFQKLMVLSQKLDVEVATLFEWTTPMGTATDEYGHYHKISQDIQRVAKAKFDSDTWVKAVRSINNRLREAQSKALVSFLLVQKELAKENSIHDADGLFEYFLIDVQMTSLVETSRVVQGTSSIQLFIQRCFLGLEAGNGVPSTALDRNRWRWMEKYRVWEANRKIYLYPENWIEPSLRDNKTEQFKELESELLQKNISAETVDSAIKRYASNVADISNLQAIAMHLELLGKDGKKVHVFARTRASPYAYLYNTFTSTAAGAGYWAGWQDLKIDIPHLTDLEIADTPGGSHLAPIMFQGRLILFVAEYMSRQEVRPDNGDSEEEKKKAKRVWDIRMSYTECRDGRWIARRTCPQSHSDRTVGRTAGGYVLIPAAVTTAVGANATPTVTSVTVSIYWTGPVVAGQVSELATWSFDGVQFSKLASAQAGQLIPDARYFGVKWNEAAKSTTPGYIDILQAGQTSDAKLKDKLPRIEDGDSNREAFRNKIGPSIIYPAIEQSQESSSESFYNGLSGDIMAASAEVATCDNIYRRLSQIGTDRSKVLSKFDPKSAELIDTFGAFKSKDDVETFSFNERSKLYSLYNWELGLHIPMITIEKLLQSQQYEKALRMCHTIFDPSIQQTDENDDARRCWKFVPFKVASTVSVTQMFMRLSANEEDVRIQEWRDNPFLPHLVARSRPQAYMRWVLTTYIRILIAWGDSLFKQNSLESIPQAIQMYVLASHVYGPRGEAIPQQKQVQAQSFWSLCKRFDDFSNVMVELEQSFPYSSQSPLADELLFDEESTYTPTIFGSAETLYFSIPDNPAIRALVSTIDDRLFKIRNSQDINGIFRKLPLFSPPIDPALLVQAAAQGLSLESVLQDLQAPLPNCKVSLLFGKAFELINEVRTLGQSLVSIREKKDMEQLSALRQRHEIALQKTVMESKNLQLDEANQALANLQSARTAAVSRLSYYLQLVDGDLSGVPDVDRDFQELDAKFSKPISEGGLGLSDMELESMKQTENAGILSATSTGILTAAGILDLLPNTAAQGQPLGVGVTVSIGPQNFATGLKTAAGVIGLAGDIIRHKAGMASTKAGYQRAMQERIMQANSAGYEVVSINKQIISAKIRIAMANKEITMQQQQMDQSQEITTFFREKYATADLYSWMDGVTKTLYHQYYTRAFELAKKAELAFRFERPQQSKVSYIQSGYFDSARDGLLAGEKLYHDLKRLETDYMQERGHTFEVTKSISLRLLDPVQLLNLRDKGSCEFDLDELLFDMDFPGHYLRRIKSVSVTIPCVVGPYTSVNGTLELRSSAIRISPEVGPGGATYARNAGAADRFASASAPIKSAAVCSGQNDAGVFQLDFNDSSMRYLPFEGAGAISKWQLTLPELRMFDYDTIFDVVLQLRYTSWDGGEAMKAGATAEVNKYLQASSDTAKTTGRVALIDVRAEHATAWSAVREKAGMQSVPLGSLAQRLPFFTQRAGAKITLSTLTAYTDEAVKSCDVKVDETLYNLTGKSDIGKLRGWTKDKAGGDFGSKWSMKLDVDGRKPSRCMLLIGYLVNVPK